MRLIHKRGETWYKVLYHHTMYAISLPNIEIKNTTKTELKLINVLQYYEGGNILFMTSRYLLYSPPKTCRIYRSIAFSVTAK